MVEISTDYVLLKNDGQNDFTLFSLQDRFHFLNRFLLMVNL